MPAKIPRLVAFDLDGTLAPSKSPMLPSTARAFRALLEKFPVAVISGGAWTQFEKQFFSSLGEISADAAARLFLLPNCGSSFRRFENGAWTELYAKNLTPEQKARVFYALYKMITQSGVKFPDEVWGEQIEDRESQISFSPFGQRSPLEKKRGWNLDLARRQKVYDFLQPMLPDLEVRFGGESTMDITLPGIDKAYGLRKIAEVTGIPCEETLFIGDRLGPGGNDEPARRTGAVCREVEGPADAEKIIAEVLARA